MFTRLRGVLFVLSIVAAAPARAAETTAQPSAGTIRVVARATIAAKPDRAELDLGVTTEGKTAAAAASENSRQMAKVLAGLKKAVGADGELKTSELGVVPRYEEGRDGKGPLRLAGYRATNRVLVKIADLAAVGSIVDAALAAGANTVDRLEYTLKDREAVQNQALRAASAKARARATAMAEGQGLRVGDVISVAEGEGGLLEGGAASYRFSKAADVDVPVVAGTIDVTAEVTVIFAFKR